MPRWLKRLLITGSILFVVIAGIVTFAGFVHFVPSDMKLCSKESWGLKDTFIDPDEFIGRNKLEIIDRMPTVRALELCGILTFDKENESAPSTLADHPKVRAANTFARSYEDAKRAGNVKDQCLMAKGVVDAYIDTPPEHFETSTYNAWIKVKRTACRRAGYE